MNIIVLNGSPKGTISVTMQYVQHIQNCFPEHTITIFNVAQRIKRLEKDSQALQEIFDAVAASDGVLWASPVYFLLVPAQYKRFIELIFEHKAEAVFAHKYAASLTTSIHFYDHTAHNYIQSICDDLQMRYVGSSSPEMNDLMHESGRTNMMQFAEHFFQNIQTQTPTFRGYQPVTQRHFSYTPGVPDNQIDVTGKKVLVVTDATPQQENLVRMVERFKASFAQDIEVIHLRDISIKGGCLGCLHCGYDNECVYKDDYVEFYNTHVKTADILVFAGTIKDRYLSSRWKMFFDRSFFNGHVPTLIGKQIGFIISGPLGQNHNLRQILEGWTELQLAHMGGLVTDEYGDSQDIDQLLQATASRLMQFALNGYIKPSTFLGVGGKKIFRDDIWGRLRPVFQADHRAYKRLGLYDFPQKDFRVRVMNSTLPLLLKIPRFRKEFTKRIKSAMIQPYQRVLELD
ncbi:MAG: NAD(P)H-dependent oxidoreductase [Chloroflexota bacterium]